MHGYTGRDVPTQIKLFPIKFKMLKTASKTDLSGFKISGIIRHRREALEFQPLISVHEDTTLAMVMMILREHGILSLPVYTSAQDGV